MLLRKGYHTYDSPWISKESFTDISKFRLKNVPRHVSLYRKLSVQGNSKPHSKPLKSLILKPVTIPFSSSHSLCFFFVYFSLSYSRRVCVFVFLHKISVKPHSSLSPRGRRQWAALQAVTWDGYRCRHPAEGGTDSAGGHMTALCRSCGREFWLIT